MQEYPDIESGQFDDIDANFGATWKDTIIVLEHDDYRTRRKKTVPMLSDNHPPPRVPRFLKMRVYWARLLHW